MWLIRTGDHTCRLVLSTPGWFRWPLQKEEFSLIFVRLPGWGIPIKTKAWTFWKWRPGLARQTKTWGDPSKVYIHERILTRHEKAWHLWRWSRDRASHGWLGRSQHGPLHRHKQDAQVCGHCPLPGVQKTNERAAWPPTPPGGQEMTSLRPNLYGFNFFWFFCFFASTWPTLTRSLVLVVTWEFDKVFDILIVIFFPGGGSDQP